MKFVPFLALTNVSEKDIRALFIRIETHKTDENAK